MFLPIITIFVAFLYPEHERSQSSERRTLMQEAKIMGCLLMKERVFQMILVVSVINIAPNLEVIYTFFMTDRLGFDA